MDGEEVMMGQKTLPEALVEKIIAMMPFPSIFKARCLSKSWLARFSSISSLHVDEEKWVAASFQKELSKWSNNWDTFSPVLFQAHEVKGLEAFVAYKRASQNWSKIPSLSFLSQGFLCPDLISRQMEGPLLYGLAHPEMNHTEQYFVANVLTRSKRHLPPRPDALASFVLCHKVVIRPSLEAYKVILICKQKGEGAHHYRAQIFDSKLDLWSGSKSFEASIDFTDGQFTAAHLDGVLYMASAKNPQSLLACNVEEVTVEELTLSLNGGFVSRVNTVNLVVCNVNCLMLVTGDENSHRSALQVFKIELGERRLLPLAMSPRDCPLTLGFRLLPPAGDGNCIWFWKVDNVVVPPLRYRWLLSKKFFRVVAYNVDEDVWTSFPVPEETTATGSSETKYRWFGSSFRPGLSPFVAV